MQRILWLSLIVSVALFSSCSVGKAYRSPMPSEQINELALFEPLADISLIAKGSQAMHSDSLSYISRRLIAELLPYVPGMPPVKSEIFLGDDDQAQVFFGELDYMQKLAETRTGKKYYPIKLPQTTLALLNQSGSRYGIIVFLDGFTRTSSNYVNQSLLGAGVAILTLGSFYYTPVKAHTNIYVLILDGETGEVVYYRKSQRQGREPLDQKGLLKELSLMFSKYFVAD